MEYLSAVLTKRMIRLNIINSAYRNDYEYAIQVWLEKIIGFSILLLLAVISHYFFQTVLFLICFSNIRKYSGGYHAKTFVRCLLLSVMLYFGYIRIMIPILQRIPWINVFLLVVSLMMILVIGAVNHPDMHWDEKEYSTTKNVARMVAIMEVGIITALWVLEITYTYILFMSMGVTLSAFMLLLAKVLKQEVSMSEERN